MRGNKHKLEHEKFKLDEIFFIIILFFNHKSGQLQEQVAQQGCEISILGDFQDLTRQVSKQPEKIRPALSQALD